MHFVATSLAHPVWTEQANIFVGHWAAFIRVAQLTEFPNFGQIFVSASEKQYGRLKGELKPTTFKSALFKPLSPFFSRPNLGKGGFLSNFDKISFGSKIVPWGLDELIEKGVEQGANIIKNPKNVILWSNR